MELVIKLPEEMYKIYHKRPPMLGDKGMDSIAQAIATGIPLPAGHGRLIDIDDIEWAKHQEERNYIDYDVVDWDDIMKAPTIIEADKEQEE